MQLAELNVGYALYPLDDPRMAGFMDNLDKINTLAERSTGFVWRMQSEGGNATDIAVPGDEKLISNMSVWTDPVSLGNYVFNTVHGQFYEKRPEWFETMGKMHFVMWWVLDGHQPTLDEAMDRLAHLQANGSTEHAFGWDHIDQSLFRRCSHAAE
ncbi:MAG: DUF3291 domain-containing protein [Planktotalea sp.]|uniref:DUF3291 domain-containing protein n=1 Tax=Planktotalea sp. TaxID=2029877 RepID=UPI003C77990F